MNLLATNLFNTLLNIFIIKFHVRMIKLHNFTFYLVIPTQILPIRYVEVSDKKITVETKST